jgi:electron transfer flavoprotein beta subunit
LTPTAAVLVRRIPDPGRLQMDRKTGTILTEGVPFILNPVDRGALELALRLKDEHDWRVVAVTIDAPEAAFEMREALAMGADEAILLADAAFGGNDPTMQAQVFRLALKKLVDPRIVLAASRSVDHTWSTVGPQLAALFDWPLIIEAEDLALSGDTVTAHAHTGGAYRALVEADLPAVVTVARQVVRARHATSWGVAEAFDGKQVLVKGLADLDVQPPELKELAPRTETTRLKLERHQRKGTTWEGETESVGRILARRIFDLGFAGRRR